jgi:hypothetical protein
MMLDLLKDSYPALDAVEIFKRHAIKNGATHQNVNRKIKSLTSKQAAAFEKENLGSDVGLDILRDV